MRNWSLWRTFLCKSIWHKVWGEVLLAEKILCSVNQICAFGRWSDFQISEEKKLLFACLFGCFRNASYMLILYLFLSHPSLTFSRTRTHKQTLCLPFLCLCFAFLAKPSLYLLFSLSPFLLFSFLLYFLSVHSESSLTHSFSTFFLQWLSWTLFATGSTPSFDSIALSFSFSLSLFLSWYESRTNK